MFRLRPPLRWASNTISATRRQALALSLAQVDSPAMGHWLQTHARIRNVSVGVPRHGMPWRGSSLWQEPGNPTSTKRARRILADAETSHHGHAGPWQPAAPAPAPRKDAWCRALNHADGKTQRSRTVRKEGTGVDAGAQKRPACVHLKASANASQLSRRPASVH